MTSASCFKAYDVRGRIPDQLNEELAYRIGRAYAEFIQPANGKGLKAAKTKAAKIIVGYDARRSSPAISGALSRGLRDGGLEVVDIGLCGTEQVYFAVSHLGLQGGIMVTASHNPKEYNGMKFVRENSRPISADSGLLEIRALAEKNQFAEIGKRGRASAADIREAYIAHLLSYIDRDSLAPLRVLCNAGNGCAGETIDLLEPHLPCQFIKLHHEADGSFPNGVPNPALEENRQPTVEALLASQADLGLAWDGDFDRCFFFDEQGAFVEGYYIVGLLAESFLNKHPHDRIVHDPRLVWNTQAVVEELRGEAVQSKAGHAFIKEKMREADAVYGGEMSAHHYFRDFFYCDSGMIPWLLMLELMSRSGKPLSALVAKQRRRFPISGELNREVADAEAVFDKVLARYGDAALEIDRIDGISLSFADWRFNLRASNTEPVVRLNVEARGNRQLMNDKTAEILSLME